MAAAVRERLQADIGIGITGVAGPDPQDGVPVGQVYIALDGGGKLPSQALAFRFAQSREAIKRRAVTQAIMLLRRAAGGGVSDHGLVAVSQDGTDAPRRRVR